MGAEDISGEGHFDWIEADIFSYISPQPPLTKMTRRRNTQQRKNSETVPSPLELLDMDINSMLEREFRVTIIQAMIRLEKTISGNVESLKRK